MSLKTRMKAIATARHTAPVADADTKQCKRRTRRKSLALPGLLTFPNMRLAVPCTIADMSGDGARVQITQTDKSPRDAHDLPNRLTLVMRLDHMSVDCTVVWRREDKLGLRFVGSPQSMPRVAKS